MSEIEIHAPECILEFETVEVIQPSESREDPRETSQRSPCQPTVSNCNSKTVIEVIPAIDSEQSVKTKKKVDINKKYEQDR